MSPEGETNLSPYRQIYVINSQVAKLENGLFLNYKLYFYKMSQGLDFYYGYLLPTPGFPDPSCFLASRVYSFLECSQRSCAGSLVAEKIMIGIGV